MTNVLKLRIKKALRPLLFTPRFGRVLTPAVKRRQEPRPFFGHPRSRIGGPNVRTRRMARDFGNHWLLPNIVYAQSAWTPHELGAAATFRRRTATPLVFNQNGWYYRGWLGRDGSAENAELVKAQQASDYVIYQSRFCRDAGRALTGYVALCHEVLHNAVPDLPSMAPKNSDGRTCWLSAVFTPDAQHILRPVIDAFRLLHSRLGAARAPRLLLAGRFVDATRQSAWFQDVERELLSLQDAGICEWRGEYTVDELPQLLARADIALHLRYKDSCPNAVVERMMLGLPHVFSNSGGTPELVGEAGVGLEVGETWDDLLPVDPTHLSEAILEALDRRDELSKIAIDQSRLFSWQRYVARHAEIFESLLSGARPSTASVLN